MLRSEFMFPLSRQFERVKWTTRWLVSDLVWFGEESSGEAGHIRWMLVGLDGELNHI